MPIKEYRPLIMVISDKGRSVIVSFLFQSKVTPKCCVISRHDLLRNKRNKLIIYLNKMENLAPKCGILCLSVVRHTQNLLRNKLNKLIIYLKQNGDYFKTNSARVSKPSPIYLPTSHVFWPLNYHLTRDVTPKTEWKVAKNGCFLN